jgi:hypothetical protein
VSSKTYPTISLRSYSRSPRSSLHWPLLPILDATSAHHVKSTVLQSIPCLFGCIYHTTTCSQMLATFSHKRYPKIYPDAPRNACGVRTAAGQVCLVLTHRCPNQVTILSNHHVFIMLHATCNIIVQTLSPFMISTIKNVQSFHELSADSTD